jgi:excisionase family DNA binding protein
MQPGSLTVQEAANLLGVDPRRVEAAARERRLAAVRDGQKWQVLLDSASCLVYRAQRLTAAWEHERVQYIGRFATPWPADIDARVNRHAVASAGTRRERELLELLEKERRDREFDRMAAQSRREDQDLEVARLRALMEDERRRRELAIRAQLLALAALIPPADPEEWDRLGLPNR